jgi:hypothetical protein
VKFINDARFELKHFPKEWGPTGESDVKESIVLTFTWDEFVNNEEFKSRKARRDIIRGVHV